MAQLRSICWPCWVGAGGTSSDMLFERITACWNPDQRMPANIVAEFWRRLHMWFIDAEIPFAKVCMHHGIKHGRMEA
ncbi:hypothetical protein HaLaN_06223 [Haematococcus lacustris]|uniref:Uncharacterized protein n=1 Tax=Haematococcus lacustris TaxID=44745 RepID=A0A699YVI7_HAELA|nr:hypothetical protein HaLaN_06223 [Haematococcus lacustris]